MYDQDVSAKMALWRQKARNNELTVEEMREAITVLRAGRLSAHTASAATKTRAASKKTPVDSDQLLGELDGL